MLVSYAEEEAVDELVRAVLANQPEVAFAAIDRLLDAWEDGEQLRERVAVARRRKR